MDEDGDLYIVDRKKDMFISGGENVYPAEVENAIFELPRWPRRPSSGSRTKNGARWAGRIVVLKPGQDLTETEVLDSLKGRLAKYKVPKSVVFADQLPRNAAGKVLKNTLREKFS